MYVATMPPPPPFVGTNVYRILQPTAAPNDLANDITLRNLFKQSAWSDSYMRQ